MAAEPVGIVALLEHISFFPYVLSAAVFLFAFPNLIGLYLLQDMVKAALDDYWKMFKAGEFKVYDETATAAERTSPIRPVAGRGSSRAVVAAPRQP